MWSSHKFKRHGGLEILSRYGCTCRTTEGMMESWSWNLMVFMELDGKFGVEMTTNGNLWTLVWLNDKLITTNRSSIHGMNRYELKFIWFNSLHLHAFVPIFNIFVTQSTFIQDKQNLGAHNDVVKKHHLWHHFTVRFEPWPQCRYHRTSDLWIVLGPSIPATPTVLGWWMLLPNKGFKWKWMIWLLPKMPEKMMIHRNVLHKWW